MTNLSHWDIQDVFGDFEAAALIVGTDPLDIGENSKIIYPIHQRMESCYLLALEDYSPDHPLVALLSEAMESGQVMDKKSESFSVQKFTRKELSRWLSAIGFKSAYRFDLKQPDATQDPPGRWPWGNYHTELLGHLEAAALRYWVNYDPNETTSAPINATVSEWLQTKRKVSQKMADGIATLLRADGLPTGPRK